MTGAGEWQLVLTAPARRALCDRLPEAVVTAVIDFLTPGLTHTPALLTGLLTELSAPSGT